MTMHSRLQSIETKTLQALGMTDPEMSTEERLKVLASAVRELVVELEPVLYELDRKRT
jgi:hypothetical protein